MRERSFITPRFGADITTFWRGGGVQNSFKIEVGRGSSPGHVLHPFLLALHTNLAADVAKLGVCVLRAHGGGTPDTVYPVPFLRVHGSFGKRIVSTLDDALN